MTSSDVFSREVNQALEQLWEIFKHLSYKGKSHSTRNGLAGIVGISKAVLLLTEGRIGPAFDSSVRNNIGIGDIKNSFSWIEELEWVADDINKFQKRNGCLLKDVVPPEYSDHHNGRLYDMAFWSRD